MRSIFLRAAATAALPILLAAPAFAAQPLLPAGGHDQVPTRLATLPAPQGAFERHDKFLATLNASIIALARPQRQCALQIVSASGLRIEAAAR